MHTCVVVENTCKGHATQNSGGVACPEFSRVVPAGRACDLWRSVQCLYRRSSLLSYTLICYTFEKNAPKEHSCIFRERADGVHNAFQKRLWPCRSSRTHTRSRVYIMRRGTVYKILVYITTRACAVRNRSERYLLWIVWSSCMLHVKRCGVCSKYMVYTVWDSVHIIRVV